MPLIVEIKTGGEFYQYEYQIHAQRQLAFEANQKVDFEPKKHIYTKGGVQIPSITGVLKLISNYGFIDEYYRDRGAYIHEATALMDGIESGQTVDYKKAKYKKYLTAWNRFKKEHKLNSLKPKKDVIIETPMISKFGFAGTLDRFYPKVFEKWILWAVYLYPTGKFSITPYKYKPEILHDFLALLRTHKLRQKFNIK